MMDEIDSGLESHLNGYNLPSDSLWEIKRLLEKRYRDRFSVGLSPEGRLAMQQVLELESETDSKSTDSPTKSIRTDKGKRRHGDKNVDKRKRNISFSASYKNSSANRLDGDITDAQFKKEELKKRAIGGKLENAMETIEIVKHGDKDSKVDEAAIEETAKLNSVEKCLVWMEVNDEVDPSIPDSLNSARSTTSVPNTLTPVEQS